MGIISDVEKCVVFYAGTGAESQVNILNARSFFNARGIDLIVAGPNDLTQAMGQISGLADRLGRSLEADDFVLPEGKVVSDQPLFWLAGFDKVECSSLLKELAAADLGAGILKAMATDRNLNWTLTHLIYDVALEHELVGAFMELRQTVRQTEVIVETVGLPPQAKADFDERIKLAKAMVEADQIPEEAALMRRLSKELKMLVTLGMDEA